MPKLIKDEFIKKDAIIQYLNWRSEFERNDYFSTDIGKARWLLVHDIKEFVERMNVYSLAVPTCKECASFRPGSENGYCREHDRFVKFTDFCSRGTPVDKSSTITAPNKPLTLDELREMVGDPVYDYLGQEWYVIQEYYDHELLMTDGTCFDDRQEINRVNERFYRRPPEEEKV